MLDYLQTVVPLLLTGLILWRDGALARPAARRAGAILLAAAAVAALTLGVFGAALDAHVASFWPTPARGSISTLAATSTRSGWCALHCSPAGSRFVARPRPTWF